MSNNKLEGQDESIQDICKIMQQRCWARKNAQEKKLDMAEIRMLWMSGVTKLDGIRNEMIRLNQPI